MSIAYEKLRKYITLEINRNYDNKAILGGLERIFPVWEKEAQRDNIDDEAIQHIRTQLEQYENQSIDDRQRNLQELLNYIQDDPQFSPDTSIKEPTEDIKTGSRQAFNEPQDEDSPSESMENQPDKPSYNHQAVRMVSAQELSAPVTVIKGIGVKYAKILEQLDIYTLKDIIYNFPRRYDDYSKFKPIKDLKFGDEITVLATVQNIQKITVRNRNMDLIEAVVSDTTGYLRITWYNQKHLMYQIKPGDQISLSGKITMKLGRLGMESPDWEELDREHLHTGRIVPIYSLTSGANQKQLRKYIHDTVSFYAPRMQDHLPESIKQAAGLEDLSTALQQIHFPDSDVEIKKAQERLAFDEIFALQLGLLKQKRNWQSVEARVYTADDTWMDSFTSQIPFTLTQAQQKAITDIRHDLASGHPMDRLIQGDVGSGKTIVAAVAASIVTANNAQAAIMAPTGILAEQHYRNLSRLLTSINIDGKPVLAENEIHLLVGGTSTEEKEVIRQGLLDGSIKMVVGTHALLEEPVQFQNLQLVVIDEQHRFGVEQRTILRQKGDNPHLIVMTATPIPRSLALTMYGDLDLTVMDELPPGRQPVKTYVLRPIERERAYQFIRSQVDAGHQVFVIYPLVEKTKESQDESKTAVAERQRLQEEIFPDLKIALLHGRMRPEEKDKVMLDFRDQKYHILVSTSVIEVGVDIPNATVMLVEGADRFGLAQLHQFRGRVGRGQDKAFCILIPEKEDNIENARLAVMAETNDGFILAERDLEQRGPGEFLGTRQSGMPELKIARITDIHLIEKARNLANQLFDEDSDLTKDENKLLNQMIQQFWQNWGEEQENG